VLGLSYDDEFMRRAKYISDIAHVELDEILRKVEEYIEEMGGLIKPDGALSLIAMELGVEISSETVKKPLLRLDRLVPGMRKASVRGRISKIYGVIEYVNRSGERSERAELRISDDYGQADVIIWSQSLVDEVKRGELREGDEVLLSDVRVASRGGRIVIHLSSDSKIEVLSRGVAPASEVISSTEEIYGREGEEIDFRGTVVRTFPVSEFMREDGRKGRRGSAIVQGEDGGTIRVLFWGDKASYSENLKPGALVTLRNFRVITREDSVELHSTLRSSVDIEGGIETIEATVLYKFPEESSLLGKKFLDILVEIDGELAILRIWDKWVDLLRGMEPPFIVRVGPIFRRYDDLLSLSRSGNLEIVEIVDRKVKDIEKLARSLKYKRVPIGEASDGFREFRGTIIGISEEARVSWHCPLCGARVSYEYGSYSCPNCGPLERAIPLLYLSLTLDDGTGVARVMVFGRNAERLLRMSTEDVIRRADELGQPFHSIPTDELSAEILGREVIVRGKATYMEGGLVKMVLDEIEPVNYSSEVHSLIREIEELWLGAEGNENSDG
jgi:ssDNA-binding replication factor A large subunit